MDIHTGEEIKGDKMIGIILFLLMQSNVAGAGGCPYCGIDVPAIVGHRLLHVKGQSFVCGQDMCFASKDEYEEYPTCSDRSRVILHSEDGHVWCHKVQP